MLALHALSVAHVALTAPKHDWVAENGDINWFQYNKDLADTNKKHAKDNSENLLDETAEKDAADDLPTAENAFSDEFGDWGIDDSALMNIVFSSSVRAPLASFCGIDMKSTKRPTTISRASI